MKSKYAMPFLTGIFSDRSADAQLGKDMTKDSCSHHLIIDAPCNCAMLPPHRRDLLPFCFAENKVLSLAGNKQQPTGLLHLIVQIPLR